MKRRSRARRAPFFPALIKAFGFICALAAAGGAAATEAFETKLGNGLRVIVLEDHRAPTVAHFVWYRCGSIDETDGTSGVAHVLEHMMFKGTAKLAEGEYSKRVALAGGRDNAFTSRDYTAYYVQVPKARLTDMMALEADRMANLAVRPQDFAKEIKVVMEERRLRTEDQPRALVHEALLATAFKGSPYRRPIIGWMADLEHMTAQDARDWYQRWYVPNNAFVVVVGDVDHASVFKLAAQYYGKIPARPLAAVKTPSEPPQRGMQRVEVKAPAQLPYLAMAWKVPKLSNVERDREAYALDVLAAVLDGGDAARFTKNLVRATKIAESAGVSYDATERGDALFIVDGTPAAGHTTQELEAALRAEIASVASGGVSEQELERVKVQLVASQVYKRDSLMSQAIEIGAVEGVGLSWRDIDRMTEQLKTVTAAEVRAVAAKYFGDEQLTVARLDPQPLSGAPRAPAANVGHLLH
ncbi:MAG: insulinase family protein [Rhodocyclaceae bacterium]|nr:insulinase family protein [Rhodocyclaceae bacterium]MBX3671085.1 insulinase family protein [Rhodocyclaceae bacterium]